RPEPPCSACNKRVRTVGFAPAANFRAFSPAAGEAHGRREGWPRCSALHRTAQARIPGETPRTTGKRPLLRRDRTLGRAAPGDMGLFPDGPGGILPAVRRSAKADRIRAILTEFYPEPVVPLRHHDPFTLLVAT